MDSSIYWAAFLSFIVGACGYFIARFWIMPIGRYRLGKGRLNQALQQCQQQLPESESGRQRIAGGKELFVRIRRCSMDLVDLYQGDLPYWYRLVLVNRQEDPIKASDSALSLENCRNSAHLQRKLESIRGFLRLKPLDG